MRLGANQKRNGWRSVVSFISIIALIVFISFSVTSCSGNLDATIKGDSSVRATIRLDIPDALSVRVRQFVGLKPQEPLFSTEAVRKQFLGQTNIALVDVSSPTPDILTSVVWVQNLEALIADTSLVPMGMICYQKISPPGQSPAMRELSVNLSRENAPAMLKLFPGIDRRIIDSLSPPALEADPVSAAEYRLNLEQLIIGKKNMPAFDACAVNIAIATPKMIVSATGGSISGTVFRMRIPLFALLTLEKPISFSLRWHE